MYTKVIVLILIPILIYLLTVVCAEFLSINTQNNKFWSKYSNKSFGSISNYSHVLDSNEQESLLYENIRHNNKQKGVNQNFSLRKFKIGDELKSDNNINNVMRILKSKFPSESRHKKSRNRENYYKNQESRPNVASGISTEVYKIQNDETNILRHQTKSNSKLRRWHRKRIKRYHQQKYTLHQEKLSNNSNIKQHSVNSIRNENANKDLPYRTTPHAAVAPVNCMQTMPIHCRHACKPSCLPRTFYDVFRNMTIIQPQWQYYPPKKMSAPKQVNIYYGPARNWLGVKKGCNCNLKGSQIKTCAPDTGQCRCKQHFTGLKCETCEAGYYETENDCGSCQCSAVGALRDTCDVNGQCYCRANVTGRQCDRCTDKHYGFSTKGCRECDECNIAGHICDKDSGRCICPPNTYGMACEKCHDLHFWENKIEKSFGCRKCICNYYGSLSMQCDTETGSCNCHVGYSGAYCDDCATGYYRLRGEPRCKRCSCSARGTDPHLGNCTGNAVWDGGRGEQWCACDRFTGICPCKNNVIGDSCDICKEGTFGLSIDNPDGCTKCFCFGRSSTCIQSALTWGQIRAGPRILTYKPPENKHTSSYNSNFKSIQEIPKTSGDITLIDQLDSKVAVYWRLPQIFEKDLVLSYGGYFRFKTDTIIYNTSDSSNDFNTTRRKTARYKRAPLIIIDGNNIRLKYVHPRLSGHHSSEIKLDGDQWNDDQTNFLQFDARQRLMLVLQNVTGIWIKATESDIFDQVTLSDVTLDWALHLLDEPPPHALSVETCDCPAQYSGTSCQNPSNGYYRQRLLPQNNRNVDVDAIVGTAIKCECNNRSELCDIENGKCQNCRNNTSGERCETCAEGYYGFPMDYNGNCTACNCPEENRNFAISCTQNPTSCTCKEGYEGPTCEICSNGYYGNPRSLGNSCKPCICHMGGSISKSCDEFGQCNCKNDMTGIKCNECKASRHVIDRSVCAPCNECVQDLLDGMGNLSNQILNTTNISPSPPWAKLNQLENELQNINATFVNVKDFHKKSNEIFSKDFTENYSSDLKALNELINEMKKKYTRNIKRTTELAEAADNFLEKLDHMVDTLMELIGNYKTISTLHISTPEAVKRAEAVLKKIRHFSTYSKPQAKSILKKCQHIISLLNDVNNSREADPHGIMDNVKEFNNRLDQLDEIMYSHNVNISRSEEIYADNVGKLKQLRLDIDEVAHLQNISKTNLKKIKKYFKETKDLIENMSLNDAGFEDLKSLIPKIYIVLDAINKFDQIELNVQMHANNITKQVNDYKRLFNLEPEEILAVQASNRYSEITSNIEKANNISFTAQMILSEILYVPDGDDSVYAKTSIALGDSTRLERRIQNIEDNIRNHIDSNILTLYPRLDDMRMRIWAQGVANINDTRRIGTVRAALEKLISQIQVIEKNVTKSSNTAHEIYKRARDIISNNEHYLGKQYSKFLNLTSIDKINEMNKQIRNIQPRLVQDRTHMDVIKNFKFPDNIAKSSMKLIEKLGWLKYNITDAMKKLANIKVPITGSTCTRFYRISQHEPSMVSTISLSIDIPRKTLPRDKSCILFYVASDDNKQYIQIEFLSNNTVQCTLQLGKNQDERVVVGTHLPSEEGYWTINLERQYKYVKLTVISSTSAEYSESVELADNEIMDTYSDNPVILGGNGLTETGLPGCLHNAIYNGRNIGLWTFINSTKCDACKRTSSATTDKWMFNGDGYSQFRDDESASKKFSPYELSITISLTTFDENALLFLIASKLDVLKGNNDITLFLAGYLKNGHICVELNYGWMSPLILETEQIYNTGKQINFDVTKAFQNGVERLTLSLENLTETREIKKKQILRTKQCEIFFGGVTERFRTMYSSIISKLRINNGLLGALDATIYAYIGIYSKEQYEFTGLEEYHGELKFSNALFSATGYLTLNTTLTKTLDFILRTDQKDTFIVRIGSNKATIALENNHVKLKYIEPVPNASSIDGATNPYIPHLSNYISLRIGPNPNLTTHNARSIMTLIVNGVEIDHGYINDPVNGILEFGLRRLNGTIRDVRVDDELVEFSVKSLFAFENVKIGRSRAYRFDEKVGEQKSAVSSRVPSSTAKTLHVPLNPISSVTTATAMMDEQQMPNIISASTDVYNTEDSIFNKKSIIEGVNCSNISPTFTQNAAGFGLSGNIKSKSSSESYVYHRIKEKIWQGEYEIQLEFRTYERDAILLLAMDIHTSINKRRQLTPHRNVLLLRDGYLHYQVTGRRSKNFAIPSLVLLSDGKWHSIILRANYIYKSKKRRLTVYLDSREVKSGKLPSNKVGGHLYIGGIGMNRYGTAIENLIPLKQFRGCIRNLKINHVVLNFENSKYTELHQIGQCFPNIEYGTYFSGDAYATYRHKSPIRTKLSTSLYYRTLSPTYTMDSILLTTSILSVEIDHNPILFTVQLMNAGLIVASLGETNVTFDLNNNNNVDISRTNSYVGDNIDRTDSKNSMAEGCIEGGAEWHHVIAGFSADVLQLIVDGVRKDWVLPQTQQELLREYAIYDSHSEGLLKDQDLYDGVIYIGGAPSTFQTRLRKNQDNFKGCIKEVRVMNEEVDWLDMDDLHNIVLNSCPKLE